MRLNLNHNCQRKQLMHDALRDTIKVKPYHAMLCHVVFASGTGVDRIGPGEIAGMRTRIEEPLPSAERSGAGQGR